MAYFFDGDAAGIKIAMIVRNAVNGRSEVEHLTLLLNGDPVEPYLCRNGFIDVYEKHANDQNRQRYITVEKGNEAYPGQLYQCLPNNGKPSAAHAVVAEMKIKGSASIPKEIADCLTTVIALAGGK